MDISELWELADANPGTSIPLGDVVVCDICGKNYTSDPTPGGFIFGSYAYCPKCEESHLPRIREYDEEHMIRRRCPEGKSFADFVRDYRGKDAVISIERSR